jgi:hypothetical protein
VDFINYISSIKSIQIVRKQTPTMILKPIEIKIQLKKNIGMELKKKNFKND